MKTADLLRTMELWRVVDPPRVVVAPGTRVADCVAQMKNRHTGACLVVRDGRLEGIFTERDVLRKIHLGGVSLDTPVERCMTANPRTLPRNATLARAIEELVQGGYRHLPVVNDQQHPVGMVFVRGIVDFISGYFPEAVYNIPSKPQTIQNAEGA